jgi:hypothetical protein
MPDAHPSFAEFQRLARCGNVVPVYRAIVADRSLGVVKTFRVEKVRGCR